MPRTSPKSQLTSQDWIKVAFRALSSEGAGALKAEVLARKLNASKGSFYWHFKDVPSFQLQMLSLWEADATTAIMSIVNSSAPPGLPRLRFLAQVIADLNAENEYGGLRAEPAIRDWARMDVVVADAINRVDKRRMVFVAQLFQQAGFSPAIARRKARLFYGGFVGMQALATRRSVGLATQLFDLIDAIASPKPKQL